MRKERGDGRRGDTLGDVESEGANIGPFTEIVADPLRRRWGTNAARRWWRRKR